MQLSEGTAQQLVDQLDRAQDVASEALILRRIKNNITGHELRKIAYIRAGLIPTLTDILSARSPALPDELSFHALQTHEEAIWWHASSVIVVLANAGTAFTNALLDGNLLSLLVTRLQATDPAERVALNLVKCLNTIAANLPLDDEKEWTADQSLTTILYTPENAACLTRFAAILPETWSAQQRLEEVLALICSTCRFEKQILCLMECGLLEILCQHLSQYVLFQYHQRQKYASYTQRPATGQTSYIPLILETIALIIEKSASRAHDFVTDSTIEEALVISMGVADATHGLAPDGSLPHGANRKEHLQNYNFPLPFIPDLHAMYLDRRSVWRLLSFPADASISSKRPVLNKRSEDSHEDANDEAWGDPGTDDAQDAAIIPWLLYLVRTSERNTRIMAAKLLVTFKSHSMLSGRTLRSLSALLVPILVELLDKTPDHDQSEHLYAEQIPAVLALLVRDHEFLQQAAVEAKAIPKLAAALRANFEGPCDVLNAIWWPTRLRVKLTAGVRDRSLGLGGPSRQMRLRMQTREGLLKALASLAPDSDVFRKEICDQGALNHIIMALEPFHTCKVTSEHYDQITVVGNSSEALIAACGAVRALTRSPTSLRTKIVDADVAKHIIKLLYTTEPAVRVAATMVVANLSHGFSPMKSSIAETSVIKKLCEQAHSANAQLRRETLFALKAFINLSSNKTKRVVVEELGMNWIRHLIATDPHDVPVGEIIGLVEKDYRKGSRIRTHNDADMHDTDNVDSEQNAEDYNHHTLEQDLEIQAELLGFLRNLTTGENPIEIIDYVMEEIGHDEFLQIMVDRLKSAVISQSRSAGTIVQNCIYVVAHLAIADARYRSPIAHNLILMKQVNALLGHSDPLIRRACCWLIIGVVYSTTESHQAAVARARDLQRLGVVANLRRMEKNDLDTDVKERASTACNVFSKLLDKT